MICKSRIGEAAEFSEFITKVRKLRLFSAVFGAAVCFFVQLGGAAAQSTPAAPVCLGKTEVTGGRMRFVVLDQHAATFESAGFQRIECPIITPEIVQGQVNRCARLLAQLPDEQDSLRTLFGLSLGQMCGATTAWANSQGG